MRLFSIGWRGAISGLAIAVMAAVPARAFGAAFTLVQNLSSSQDEPDDIVPPCLTTTTVNSAAATSVGSAVVGGNVGAAVNGMSDQCNDTAKAVANAKGLFELVATMGESEGDPITVCATVNLAQSLVASGDTSAKTKAGPAAVIVTNNGTVQVAQPPQSERAVDDDPQSTFLCQREFVLGIGDQLTIQSDATATSEMHGQGAANASANATVAVSPAACTTMFEECAVTTPSPSISHAGLGALAVALGSFGALLARRRRARI